MPEETSQIEQEQDEQSDCTILNQVLARQKRQAAEIAERKKQGAEQERLAQEEAAKPRKKGGRPKGSKNKTLMDEQPPEKQIYASELIKNGGNKYQAALHAGMSAHRAKHPERIETADFKKAFEQMLRKEAPLEKVTKRLAEGLDATASTVLSFNGRKTEVVKRPDFKERRLTAETIAQMTGAWTPKIQQEAGTRLTEETAQALITIAQMMGFNTLSPEDFANITRSHVPFCQECRHPHDPNQPHIIDASPLEGLVLSDKEARTKFDVPAND